MAAKTGNSRLVSIAHTQPAAPKLERGGTTLGRALDNHLHPIQVGLRVPDEVRVQRRKLREVCLAVQQRHLPQEQPCAHTWLALICDFFPEHLKNILNQLRTLNF